MKPEYNPFDLSTPIPTGYELTNANTYPAERCIYCGMIKSSPTGSEKQMKCNHRFILPVIK